MATLVTPKPILTADCSTCKGAGSYVTDDFNYPEGARLYVQVCVRCHNEAKLPLVQLPHRSGRMPSERQITFIGALIAELEELGDTEIKGLVMARISGYDVELASKCIKKLQLRKAQRVADKAAAQPQVAPTTRYPDVPAGRYAVRSATGNNDLDFFRVTRPEEGPWAGRTFVKRVIGGHEDTPVRGAEARKALQAIVDAGITEAGILYGQEVGCCFKCHIHLTRSYSRAMGYGPDCADNLGLPFDHAEYARSPKIEEDVS
jgi:hypothetical protein